MVVGCHMQLESHSVQYLYPKVKNTIFYKSSHIQDHCAHHLFTIEQANIYLSDIINDRLSLFDY